MKENIEKMSVAILINNAEEVIFSQIIEIAKNVKVLKIVTNRPSNFGYIEKRLYEEHGIAIQITSNKEKALNNIKLVINYDFDEIQVNQFTFCENSNIVNIKNEININNSKVYGNIFNYYKITYNEEIFNNFDKAECFDKNILYESLVYRKGNYANLRKRFELDGVRFVAARAHL